MSKVNTKLSEFFEGNRRQCRLQDVTLLLSTGKEKRMKLSLIMPLSDQPGEGTPDLIAEQLLIMGKEKSKVNFAKLGIEIESAQLRIFVTNISGKPVGSHNGASFQAFTMSAEGVDEQRRVDLQFSVYMPATKAAWEWAYENIHAEFFTEVQPSQMSLEEKPEAKKRKASNQPQLVN